MASSSNIKYLIERLYRSEWNNDDITFHDILKIMYIDKNMSIRDMSDEIGISVGSINNYLRDEGICKKISCKR